MPDYPLIESLFDRIAGVALSADPEDGDVCYGRETLADFDRNSHAWAARGKVRSGEIDGYAYWYAAQAQATRGQRRRDVIVIDLGDQRVIYGCDN